jgi:hypothetical protein
VFPYGRYPPSHAIPTRACGMQCSSSFACREICNLLCVAS